MSFICMFESMNEVKRVFNSECIIPNDSMDIDSIASCVQSMLDTYSNKKQCWTKVQRATYVMRMVNCMIRKCPAFCFAHENFLHILLIRIHNVFVEEDMDTDVLDYLRVLFPHAMSLYNHCADVDETSGELRFSHRTSG